MDATTHGFGLGKDLTLTVGTMVSCSIAMKLVTTFTGGGSEHVPVDVARGVPHIVINFPRHHCLPCYPCLYSGSRKMAAWSDLPSGGREAALYM